MPEHTKVARHEPDEAHSLLTFFVTHAQQHDHRYMAEHHNCTLCPMLKRASELLKKESR